MKVTDAHVIDPRRDGDIEYPYLRLTVDEEPLEFENSRLTWPEHGIEASRFGMFWSVELPGSDNMLDETLCGTFNTLLGTHSLIDRVVPVEVVWGIYPDDAASFALSVERARRFVRKFGRKYSYTLSDLAARKGLIQWDLEHSPKMCMYRGSETRGYICGKDRTIVNLHVHGVPMPACAEHATIVNELNRSLRKQREDVSA